MHIIQVVRHYLGFSQQELAKHAGITQPDLCEIEIKAPYGRIDKYQRLLNDLGIPVHALVTDDCSLIPSSFFERYPPRPYAKVRSKGTLMLRRNAKLFGASYDSQWNGYVIRYEDGKLVPPNTVTQHFRSFIDKHNFKPLRFHDLRHSCASLLYANGIDIKTIQELMGHAHLTTTVMYTHTLIDRKAVALTQMHDQFLLPTAEEQEESEK